MGTRADFYIGKGINAEWIGSIAWDGYPEGIPPSILTSGTAKNFREQVKSFLADRRDSTVPERGWPWPWDDSRTTDFAYGLADGCVWASCFGSNLFDPTEPYGEDNMTDEPAVFPDMSAMKNTTYGERSGLIVIGLPHD